MKECLRKSIGKNIDKIDQSYIAKYVIKRTKTFMSKNCLSWLDGRVDFPRSPFLHLKFADVCDSVWFFLHLFLHIFVNRYTSKSLLLNEVLTKT